MPLTSLWQFLIPDSLLLEIFTYLDIRDLGHVAQVCRLWQRVSQDELLWQAVARTRWKIKGPLCPGKVSWWSEVKRLVHHVPCVESQVFTEAHIDEVLDVCISHRGDMFCTTSKDSCVILWKLDFPATEITRVDTQQLFNWSLTQYSKFNNDDTLLLVCGVLIPDNVHHYYETSLGRGAVFTVPELNPLQVVNLDPPTLFGAWLTGDIFIGGNLQGLHGAIRIEAHKVPDSIPIDRDWKANNNPGDPAELFYFRGNKHHQMSILVADVACAEDFQDVHSEITSCELDSHCSTCISGRSLTDSQPGNIYQLLSVIDDSEEYPYENVKKQQNLLRGSGDSEADSDFLTHKRMRLNSINSNSFRDETTDEKSLNPNIQDLENDASFWDDMGSSAVLDHQHQWRSNAVTSTSESGTPEDNLCHSGCHNYKCNLTENVTRSVSRLVRDISSETSLCSMCKKAKLVYNQMINDLKTDNISIDGNRGSSAIARPSNSDMTISSSSEFLTDSGSVSITGLSLGSNSEFYLPSSSCSVQTDESYIDQCSFYSNKAGSNVVSNAGNSENSIGHLSCDKYYNTGCDSGGSTERSTASSDGGDGSTERSLASSDCGGGSMERSLAPSDNEHSHSCISSDELYCNKAVQTDHSWTTVLLNAIVGKDSTVHPDPSSSTLVAESTSSERTESQTYFSNLSRSCSNRQGIFRKYICFVSGAHDAIVVQEVRVDKLETVEEKLARNKEDKSVIARDARDYDNKDYYFFIKDCYITGMCLSHDHRYIYFNYRERARQKDEESDSDPEPDDPLRDVSDRNFHENIKVGVIDLVKMCRVEGLTYEGHIGFSGYPAWYICLAASENYLGSGSENARAYLWDKHYQVQLAELKHTHLVVNGLAFSPVDQEVCVSVCDDKSIIVWRSRNRMSELVDTNKQFR